MIESKEKPDFEYFCEHILKPPIKLSPAQKKILDLYRSGKLKGLHPGRASSFYSIQKLVGMK